MFFFFFFPSLFTAALVGLVLMRLTDAHEQERYVSSPVCIASYRFCLCLTFGFYLLADVSVNCKRFDVLILRRREGEESSC